MARRSAFGVLHSGRLAPWLVGLIAAAVSSGFAALNLHYNAGHYVPPLDDAYIHLQYARNIAEGHFLQYNAGDPISTGASSFLYVLALGGIGALAGGAVLKPAAVVVGIACFALAAAGTTHLGILLVGHRVGVWAGVLTALSGPLAWGSTSGMEISFTAALLVGTLVAFTRELPRARFRWTPLVGAGAALCRPESLLFATVMCCAMVAVSLRADRGGRRPRQAVWSLLPVAAGAGQLALYAAATGSATSNGVAAKSLLHPPRFDAAAFVGSWADHVGEFLAILTGLRGSEFIMPGALLLAALGVAELVRRGRSRAVVGIVLATGFILLVAAVATLSTALWQHLRYLQPYLPVLLLLVVVGVAGLGRQVSDRGRRRTIVHGLLGVAGVFSLAGLPVWAHLLGSDSAHMRERVVSLAAWMKGNLPPDARVGVHDTGAAAYISDHPVVDMVGLTTNGMAEPAVNGVGSLYEALSDVPPGQRPDYFAIYDDLPNGLNLTQLADASLFSPEPVLGIPELSVYAADWTLAGSGDRPHLGVSGTVRDHLDVASLRSEERHDYTVETMNPSFQPATEVRTVDYPDRRMVDSARHVFGGERFTIDHLTPSRDVTLVMRYDTREPKPDIATGARQVEIIVDGAPVNRHDMPPHPRGWNETSVTIPGELVRGPEISVTTGPAQEFVGPYPDYRSFGYWAIQDNQP